jgi:ssDNA-binding replication factor A large subunit
MVTVPSDFTGARGTQKRAGEIAVEPDPELSAFEEMLADDHTARTTLNSLQQAHTRCVSASRIRRE